MLNKQVLLRKVWCVHEDMRRVKITKHRVFFPSFSAKQVTLNTMNVTLIHHPHGALPLHTGRQLPEEHCSTHSRCGASSKGKLNTADLTITPALRLPSPPPSHVPGPILSCPLFLVAYLVHQVQTPIIDGLVQEGIKLDRHYVHKFCSPTRCAIQSGRAPIHVNVINAAPEVSNPLDPVAGYAGMARNMTGIAEVMKRGGYKTHFAGKWDVGMATGEHTPVGRGYDTTLHYYDHVREGRGGAPCEASLRQLLSQSRGLLLTAAAAAAAAAATAVHSDSTATL